METLQLPRPYEGSSLVDLTRRRAEEVKSMKFLNGLGICVLLGACALSGCKKKEALSGEDQAAAAKLKSVKDPIADEIYAFRQEVRQDYNNRRFDELEKRAVELRRDKALFGNGSWKLVQFYESFTCRPEEPESMWELHDQIHRDWITTFPQSITARVAYADFLMSHAWQARGSGFAKTVTPEGGRLFSERVAAAQTALREARHLPEKDPFWWSVILRVARAQQWSKEEFDRAVEEAKASEPQFSSYDVSRAESLLPRWYGEPGDWEAYADQAAVRPDGLGAEVYGRIVISLRGYYGNIFRETTASWPNTREGLEQMRQRYPRSLDVISQTALLAVMAEDRVLAKEMFDRLDDRYLEAVWRTPEYFVSCRKWAETRD